MIVHKTYKAPLYFSKCLFPYINARDGIRTHEYFRNQILSPSPLTWLDNPRKLQYNLLSLFCLYYIAPYILA